MRWTGNRAEVAVKILKLCFGSSHPNTVRFPTARLASSRRLLILLAIVCMLAGCGGGGGASVDPTSPSNQTPQLKIDPVSVGFGNVSVGASSSQMVSLSNTGIASIIITQAVAAGAGFRITGISLPATLPPGQSTSVSAVFSPATAASSSGSISVVSNASNSPTTISLSGTGITQSLSASPASLSFGNVTVNTSNIQPVVVTNTGSASVTVSQAAATGSGFSATGPALPITLAAGQNTTFSVTFDPTVAGSVTGNLSVISNAADSPTVASLTAVGANKHSVGLSWAASTSSGVVSYNVYRGVVSGGPYTKLNASQVTGTSYTDATVEAGQTYYYATTAVDSQGVESAYSNQAQAVIPSP